MKQLSKVLKLWRKSESNWSRADTAGDWPCFSWTTISSALFDVLEFTDWAIGCVETLGHDENCLKYIGIAFLGLVDGKQYLVGLHSNSLK